MQFYFIRSLKLLFLNVSYFCKMLKTNLLSEQNDMFDFLTIECLQ